MEYIFGSSKEYSPRCRGAWQRRRGSLGSPSCVIYCVFFLFSIVLPFGNSYELEMNFLLEQEWFTQFLYGVNDNKVLKNNWNTSIYSRVQNQSMNLSLKDEHMKSIRKTKRSLEDYGRRSEKRSTRSQRPSKKDVSQKLESYLNRFCDGHQTQKLTPYLDDPSDLRKF